MKKLMEVLLPLKTFAAMVFTGLICLYLVSGYLVTWVTGEAFNYTIPFIFVLQSLGLSILIPLLWGMCFSDAVLRKGRFFLRLILFAVSLFVLLAICLLTFFALPTDWAKLWLIVAGCFVVGIIALACLGELYFRKTGNRYTEMLKMYKADNA